MNKTVFMASLNELTDVLSQVFADNWFHADDVMLTNTDTDDDKFYGLFTRRNTMEETETMTKLQQNFPTTANYNCTKTLSDLKYWQSFVGNGDVQQSSGPSAKFTLLFSGTVIQLN